MHCTMELTRNWNRRLDSAWEMSGNDEGFGLVNWHIGRCGSSVLGSLVGQHSKVQSDREIFSRYMPRRWGVGPRPSMDFVFCCTREARRKPNQMIEIKHLPEQNLGLYPGASIEQWLAIAALNGFTKHIITFRRNGLKRLVSHALAQQTGRYVLKAGDEYFVEPIRFRLNCHEVQEGFGSNGVIAWLSRYEEAHMNLRRKLGEWCQESDSAGVCELIYEEDIERDPLIGYAKVCGCLGVSPEQPMVTHLKVVNEPLSSVLTNFSEVKALLSGSRFEWMLE